MKAADRRQYIAIAARHARGGSGSGVSLLRERSMAYGSPDLSFLEGRVDFVVVGGLAARLYMPERVTLDTDILVPPAQMMEAETALRDAGAAREGPLAVGGSAWRLPGGAALDLIALDAPWVEEAVRNPVRGRDGLPYVMLPYLVVMKLGSGRLQDLADIGRMLGGAGDEAIESVRETVRRHRPADEEDLESIMRLGKLEYGEAGNGGG